MEDKIGIFFTDEDINKTSDLFQKTVWNSSCFAWSCYNRTQYIPLVSLIALNTSRKSIHEDQLFPKKQLASFSTYQSGE